MGLGSAVKSCFSQYATFSGRARRSEFWFFYLFLQLVNIVGFFLVLVIALAVLPTSEGGEDPSGGALALFIVAIGLYAIASLALIIPSLAVSARRLHDMGQSGHWLWLNLVGLGIVPLIMAFIDSQPTTNQWGPDTKAADRVAHAGYGQPQGGFPPPPPQQY